MVSNSMNMELEELLELVAEARQTHGDDADYQELRRDLPADWPL